MMLFAVSAAEAAMALPDRVALRFGSVELYWYGLFMAAAILLVILFTGAEAKRKQLPGDTAVDVCLVAIPCGVVGARLLYVLTNRSAFSGDFAGVFRIWDGGLSIFGAVVAALIGLFVYAKAKKLPFLRILDAIVPGLALAQGIVLWGDFFNQTGYGPVVVRESRKWFPLAVRIEETGAIHYAVFFYEFLWCAAIFALLYFACRKRVKRDGQTLCLYLLLYGAGHVVFEALRVDGAYLFGSVKLSQLVCGALIVFAAAYLLILRKKISIDEAAAADIPAESIVGEPDADDDVPSPAGEAEAPAPDDAGGPAPDAADTSENEQ